MCVCAFTDVRAHVCLSAVPDQPPELAPGYSVTGAEQAVFYWKVHTQYRERERGEREERESERERREEREEREERESEREERESERERV